MIIVLPSPRGPFHMGSLSTYFAAWCLSRQRHQELAVAVDVQVSPANPMPNIEVWEHAAERTLGQFDILPSRFMRAEEVCPKRSNRVPAIVRERSYVCICGARPAPDWYENDPCRHRSHAMAPGACLRLRDCGVRVGEVTGGLRGWTVTANDVLEHVMLQRALGATTVVRGRDLLRHAETQRVLQEAVDWTPIETVFCPIIWNTWFGKLTKTAGAEPALSYVDRRTGWTEREVLRTLWEGLQVRSCAPLTLEEMASEFSVASINEGDYRWKDAASKHILSETARLM